MANVGNPMIALLQWMQRYNPQMRSVELPPGFGIPGSIPTADDMPDPGLIETAGDQPMPGSGLRGPMPGTGLSQTPGMTHPAMRQYDFLRKQLQMQYANMGAKKGRMVPIPLNNQMKPQKHPLLPRSPGGNVGGVSTQRVRPVNY